MRGDLARRVPDLAPHDLADFASREGGADSFEGVLGQMRGLAKQLATWVFNEALWRTSAPS